jgi:hypothetical protein
VIRDDVWRYVASPRRTRPDTIGQVNCRKSDDGLLDSIIENSEVSCAETRDWLPGPIENRNVHLDDICADAKGWCLLRAAGENVPDRDEGDQQEQASRHESHSQKGRILAEIDVLREANRLAAEPGGRELCEQPVLDTVGAAKSLR